MPKIKTKEEARDMADALGILMAKMAPLKETEKELKELLANYVNDSGDIDGEFYHVNVSQSERATLDKDALIAKLATFMKAGFLSRFINANTTRTPVVTVRCSAHPVKAKAA